MTRTRARGSAEPRKPARATDWWAALAGASVTGSSMGRHGADLASSGWSRVPDLVPGYPGGRPYATDRRGHRGRLRRPTAVIEDQERNGLGGPAVAVGPDHTDAAGPMGNSHSADPDHDA